MKALWWKYSAHAVVVAVVATSLAGLPWVLRWYTDYVCWVLGVSCS